MDARLRRVQKEIAGKRGRDELARAPDFNLDVLLRLQE